MMRASDRATLEPGLWGVLATPFTDRTGPVDFASLERQVELHQRAGSVGLVALGVFGEAAKLDAAEQVALVEAVSRLVPGQRVVVGIGALETPEVIATAHRLAAATQRPPVLMVQVNSPDPDAVVEHLTTIWDYTGLSVVLQDYPVASGVRIASADVARIAAACDAVVAVKSEAPPTSPAVAEMTAITDVPVFGGLGGLGLLDELAAGAAGAMTGFSFPEVLARVVAAFATDGYAAARAEYLPWMPLVNFEAQAGVGLAIRKEALHLRKVFTSGAVRNPGPAMTPALQAILELHLRHLPREGTV
jgi:4-hydroxy-tetrahydrodipicolinate synthase